MKDSNQNKLREILAHREGWYVRGGLSQLEAQAQLDTDIHAILEFINEVIGEPENMYFTKTIPQNLQELMDYTAKVRANLRAEQRKRAGL